MAAMKRRRSETRSAQKDMRHESPPAIPTHAGPGPMSSEPWYVAEGKRGQQFLDRGETGKAKEVFEALLARIGDGPTYGRALVLERLGRCVQLDGHPELAPALFREALTVLGSLTQSDNVRNLRGTVRSELGDAFRELDRVDEARKAYEAALQIAEESKDLRAQGVELGRLGALALVQGKHSEAVSRYRAALALGQQLHDPASEAVAWHQLARVFQHSGEWTEAERHYREAARIDREIGNAGRLGCHLSALAEVLQHQPHRLREARESATEALRIAQAIDPAGNDVWIIFGILASLLEKEAAAAADSGQNAALLAQARDYRHLHEYAPRILATLDRMAGGPSHGRAVILGRIGRCFQMAGRPDLAVPPLLEALAVSEKLSVSDGVKGLQGTLHSDLGEVLRAMGRASDAEKEYESAFWIAAELRDILGQQIAASRLGRAHQQQRDPDASSLSAAFELEVYDEIMTDYVFDLDLLIEGRHERRITKRAAELATLAPLSIDARPVVAPCTRTWVDDRGAVRFSLPPGEPIVEPGLECTVMRRTRREVAVSGDPSVLWRLAEWMDGTSTVADILSKLPSDGRVVAADLLAALADAGVVDVSGRGIGRFLHSTTKKGVLPAGGLEGNEVLELATDGRYRSYQEASARAVSQSVPERLRAFHALTRARRSSRDYGGLGMSRTDFDALLSCACGVTGEMPWSGREVKLRAYPSSGALYAVEIYPVVFRVEGMEEAVYHFRVLEETLERVRNIDRGRFVTAALPVEREMVTNAAAMICLTGVFPRHERKYGQGGYRMMVAEAGHVSQNLILAATALGLSARPFGGVFDSLLNQELGLNDAEESFLLAVLVGHLAGSPGPSTVEIQRRLG
jgi:SagB-type dehydrogenase family enzyme